MYPIALCYLHRNGVGKSTLLKRISARKLAGFPLHINPLLVPQDVFGHDDLTPVQYLVQHYTNLKCLLNEGNQVSIAALEEQLDNLDTETGDYEQQMEDLCNRIADLEDIDTVEEEHREITERAHHALDFFGVPLSTFSTPTAQLSGGIRKKVALASILMMEKQQLILLDEPTCHIDIDGILQLRRIINDLIESKATVILISHDIDLMNDVATNIIHFHNHKLEYYQGNYCDFVKYRTEVIKHQVRQAGALEKQRASLVHTIDNLKKKASGTESTVAKKKLDRAIESKKKKLERHGIEKNILGHRRVVQKDGIRKGSINAIDATTRNKLSHKELLKRAEVFVGPVPDKEVQFDFRSVSSSWGDEPLVMLMDVSFSYNAEEDNVFDCVECCIREGSRTIILGENGAGKSTLLSLLARQTQPTGGTAHYANGLVIGYFHQHSTDNFIHINTELVTPLSFLLNKYSVKTEQEIRGELSRFGLSRKQSDTNVKFLSGGERCRLGMASMMLEDPQLIVIDEVSNHLDCESVEALIYGLNQWNGTIILASHDAHLVKSIGGECFVIFDQKLQRVNGGIDAYVKYHYSIPR